MENKSLEERLRIHAYHLWEADGRPHGRSAEYWEKARAQLEREAAAATPAGSPTVEKADSDQPAKKPVKAKAKATPSDEGSVGTVKARPKADSKKAASKPPAKPKAAGTVEKKPKAAAKTAAKPKAVADTAGKSGKEKTGKAPAKTASTSALKASKSPKK
jgi:hypothetical protein